MKKTIILIFTIILLGISLNAQTKSTTTSTETNKTVFRPSKAQITEAQTKLKSAGKYSGETDGKYNDEFRASLKAFQEENGLEKNGKLDEATITKMGIGTTDSKKADEKSSSGSSTKSSKFRANKQQITEAQKKLKTDGSYKGDETGKYNNDFRAAVKEYQGTNRLKKSGSLNRATLEKMGIVLTDAQSAIPVNPKDLASADSKEATKTRGPVFRASKEQIMQVQKMLKMKNLYSGEETGKLDDDTRAGIKSWQKANGVKETGTLNKETLEAMKIELTDKQKAM
jgi:peptidoglycan hydrolase-like protein with peptidoglycan-binding domain